MAVGDYEKEQRELKDRAELCRKNWPMQAATV